MVLVITMLVWVGMCVCVHVLSLTPLGLSPAYTNRHNTNPLCSPHKNKTTIESSDIGIHPLQSVGWIKRIFWARPAHN